MGQKHRPIDQYRDQLSLFFGLSTKISAFRARNLLLDQFSGENLHKGSDHLHRPGRIPELYRDLSPGDPKFLYPIRLRLRVIFQPTFHICFLLVG